MINPVYITVLGGVSDLSALGMVNPGAPDSPMLFFSPVKILCLIIWLYLCLYSVQSVAYSNYIPDRSRQIVSIFSLIIGPLLLFFFFTVDIVKKLQSGQIETADVLKMIFGRTFHSVRSFGRQKKNEIELLDSAGRSFAEVYGSKNSEFETNIEIRLMTERIILDAIEDDASDILIDPKSNDLYSVRYRVDGLLQNVDQIDAEKCIAVVNSIKAVSGMDIAEKRRPQDGAFMAKIPEGSIYFRVASAGVLGGEKLSIRVLDQSMGMLRLNEIGLSEKHYNTILDIIQQSSGMALVCGPTGSGKTTTLYAMLSSMDFHSRNIVTVEDPIEHVLPEASQIEVNVKANITFANALRSILRQDPDVICVGEIRDAETAGMALQASQTGHLVLATLHSSSNMAALVRLMDLGIRPLLLASALSVIISQRLVRKLCDHCKAPDSLTDTQIESFQGKGISPDSIMRAVGCSRCNGTGYRGRTAILDVMFLDDDLKAKLAGSEISVGDMKKKGDEMGRNTLRKEGLKKVVAGITTLEEVKRVTSNLG